MTSLIPHRSLSRRLMDTESWLRPLMEDVAAPTSLDLFDAFDELDTLMARHIDWIREPQPLEALQPRVQQKVGDRSGDVKLELAFILDLW